MKLTKRVKKKPYQDKYYETRRAAFRGAKRDNDVPVTQHPEKTVSPNDTEWSEHNLDHRNSKFFLFIISVFNYLTGYSEEKEIHIREDKHCSYHSQSGKGEQSNHFNSGESEGNLKRHHYYKKR